MLIVLIVSVELLRLGMASGTLDSRSAVPLSRDSTYFLVRWSRSRIDVS